MEPLFGWIFMGCVMSYHAVNNIAFRVWKDFGLDSVMTTQQGFMMFRFKVRMMFTQLWKRARKLKHWGLNGPSKHIALKAWINKHKLSFIGLLETKVASNQMGIIPLLCNLCLMSWMLSSVVFLLDGALEKFTCEVLSLVERCNFVVTYVYGLNTPTS